MLCNFEILCILLLSNFCSLQIVYYFIFFWQKDISNYGKGIRTYLQEGGHTSVQLLNYQVFLRDWGWCFVILKPLLSSFFSNFFSLCNYFFIYLFFFGLIYLLVKVRIPWPAKQMHCASAGRVKSEAFNWFFIFTWWVK